MDEKDCRSSLLITKKSLTRNDEAEMDPAVENDSESERRAEYNQAELHIQYD